jgi:hypothetical protein
MEKKSFGDYLKIIKEENEEKDLKEQEESYNKEDVEKQKIKQKNKEVLEQIKSEKPKKEKKVFKCPPETSNISLNLTNRQRAINEFGYGPLNPLEENNTFWENKVEKWRLESVEEAKKSLCGNCSAFVITKNMLDCIAKGLESGDKNEEDAWSTIESGQLGYCEALDFKCSALRTCDAWIVGGPISDKKEKKKGDKND